MGKPAARVGDMHVCPAANGPVPHVGGPILPPGVPTVLIGGMPAATLSSMCTCTGPPDSIVMGSAGVFIGGKPAARMGDSCAHGGTVVLGCPTVLIGEAGGGGGALMVTSSQIAPLEISVELGESLSLKKAAENGTPFCEECARNKQDDTKDKVPELLECFFENEDGEIIEDLPAEGKVILVVISVNMTGEKVDIDLSDNKEDLKYKGSEIKNHTLKDFSITGDEQRIELEVST